ncbi:NAD(P)-dependent dehydrogenase, short-chain alcohol dehydrogenase family [Lentibacillus persicus]|uniref:NAD(P)-dependent dehydrogenase, short-chain alcohol dehydrogenase family n=1 Tax=Lentibacillus persicus TaxID=640948 RepID=A0A1I1X5K2_9BACI|nr:SDR family NAD(P)-dependent oxidoreductase [Lentibacillus persicus]SFE02695.1 NAD(P)-dependent dehydrogenase, short-chain alcohol dehydrogenase family [Lentibacillus persicus]
MGRLDGKVAIITGAAGNLGKTTAQLFLNEGAKVSLVDMDKERLEQAKNELSSDNVMTVEANVTKENDVKNYVDQTVDKFGSVDIFFNNAGIIGEVGPLDEQSLDNFNKVLSINATGIFLGMKYVLPVMKNQQSGSIINTSSVDGLRGSPNMTPYATSKHAVVGLTKTASLEVAENNVRVNSVHPAPVSGEMMQTVHKGQGESQGNEVDKVEEEIKKSIPLGRYADSNNIANLVLFLASDESEFITGAEYRVDGGMGATS